MRLLVLGAGAIGPASAALAASRGHAAAVWSPSGRGTAGMTGELHAEGALEGAWPVAVATELALALAQAEVAMIALPASGHRAVMERLAPVLPPGMRVLVCPSLSASPALLHGRTGAPVAALSTTPMTARRTAPDRVRVGAIRAHVEVAGLGMAAEDAAALTAELFGVQARPAADVLGPALANLNPIFHGALALTNVTRIELQEAWPQYRMMTPAVCRLMEAMDSERLALARAVGVTVPTAAEHLSRTNGIAVGPLDEMCAAIDASRGAVNGPTDMESRYVTEDVSFGLCFWQALGRRHGMAMPVTDAAVACLDALWGRSFAAANDLLEEVLRPASA